MAKCNIVPFLLRFTAIIAVVGYPVTSQVIAEQTSWDNVFKSFLPSSDEPPASQPGGSRGPRPRAVETPCALAPHAQKSNSDRPSEIWNNRPIFVWNGIVDRVEVYSKPERDLLWKQIVKSGKNYISYTGEPLKSGETYKLSLYAIPESEGVFPPEVDLYFQVVDTEKSEQITQELNQLQTEHQQKQSTPEEIALARVQYFADRQLWSDAIMESVLVENPSSSLKELLETKIPQHLCPPSFP